MDKQAAITLIENYLQGKTSKEQEQQLFDLLENDMSFVLQFNEILQEQYNEGLFNTEPNEKLRQLIQARLQSAIKAEEGREEQVIGARGPQSETPGGHATHVRRMYRWIAAASVIIVASFLVILSLSKNDNGGKPTVAQTHDVAPPTNTRAVITLANGTKVYLDSAGNGTIAQENNVNVVKNSNGEIVYLSPAGGGGLNDSLNNKRPGVDYNTLYNPRGSKVISLTLSDGTKVWLNSESSLRYPASFASAAVREVDITGEAYFEVKHNTKQPFKVHLPNGSIVEDIGTSFNINAYPDEDATRTTLIEGSVKISSRLGALAVKPKPGEQVIERTTSPDHYITISPDMDEVLAWKNGIFLLDNTDLPAIMRQIARWYDVDVVYQSKIPDAKFVGGVSKNLPLSKVLELLRSNGINVEMDGKKVIIK